MNNDKLVLSYGFDEEEGKRIDIIAKEAGFPSVKEIKNTMGKMTVKEILNGHAFEVYNCSMPEDKIILFNNFSDSELEKAIRLFRSGFTEMPILAVVTETSVNWTFERLVNHLSEERKWHKLHNKIGG